jgi:DNA-binding MarR family transcriptional regulator
MLSIPSQALAMVASSRPARVPEREASLQLRRVQADAYLDLSRIQREIERRAAALLDEHGLRDVTPAQAGALMVLFGERGPLRARELATRLGLSEVTVGRFVHALHGAGWVSRTPDPDDSRAVLLAPTPKAYRALPRFIQVSNTLLDDAFAGFTAAEVEQVAKTTERLRRNIVGGPVGR